MESRIIKTKDEYRTLRAEVERLLAGNPDVDPESDDGRHLELLAKLVEDYEKQHFQFRKPDPTEAIEFRKKEQGERGKWRRDRSVIAAARVCRPSLIQTF